jgi:hypothetical protein
MGRIPFVVGDTKPLTVHFPGMTAHEGRSGEIPSNAGIMNAMKRVIMAAAIKNPPMNRKTV